jgi:hypothetical protein
VSRQGRRSEETEILSLEVCTALLLPVAVALSYQVDQRTFKAYHRALRDVPPRLLHAACEHAVREPREPYAPRWPTAPMFRVWAEQARQRWLAEHPWAPCAACQDAAGFIEQRDEKGVSRLARCACWRAHHEQLAAAGMRQPLTLPLAAELRERSNDEQ